MKKYPKILLACPTSDIKDYCFKQWADNVKCFTYPNLKIQIYDNSKDVGHAIKLGSFFWTMHIPPLKYENLRETICRCQNEMRNKVLLEDYDYLFSLESDIFPPVNILEHLLAYKKKVIGCSYFIGQAFDSKLMVFEIQDFGAKRQSKQMNLKKSFLEFDGDLKQVYQLGLGCLLIHRSVLSILKFRVDLKDPSKSHSDTYFHEDLRQLNIPCYMDTNIIPEHQNLNWHHIKI